ncbi:exodeoxyribonuclease V alpha subunit [Chitinivorax tropicus]|uniref:RecBCD enzyme subunit RecD n=1 Tax=Chitinivorax tropicus TaxID=714531 RepID=A0A840MLX3_9PROT|nr:exodeoxyribonuclease V subunit alpha [Chitinivorax tropicus]MBB5019410.1 exodeoxyribonuclease V alpha subunit [Chitinivorax tropicus]
MSNTSPSALASEFLRVLHRRIGPLPGEVTAVVAQLMQATSQGHVCLDLLPRDDAVELADQLLSSGICGRAGAFQPLILDLGRLYLARYWHYESQLAKQLGQLAGPPTTLDHAPARAVLDQLFTNNQQQPDWQKAAAAAALINRLTVISGGPGTGKTSTVVNILGALQALHDGQLIIQLAAPTGKAAARMAEAIRARKHQLPLPPAIIDTLPEQAQTIHRLLGPRPESIYFRHHAGNPLPCDVLVLDEASMIDLALMAKLVDALPAHSRLILLGDKDQLASVEAGAVFGDLCSLRALDQTTCDALAALAGVAVPPSAREAGPIGRSVMLLTHSYRFDGRSGIGELARLANQGEAVAAMALLQGNQFADIRWQEGNMAQLANRLETRIREGFGPFWQAVQTGQSAAVVMAAFNRFRLLAATREGEAGMHQLNRLSEQVLRGNQSPGWYHGRPVMITSNDYNLKLFNGDVGIALDSPQGLRVWFEAEGGLRSITPARLPPHDTAYCMTVHKSQGSEFDQIALVLPDAPLPVLTRNLIYTGITRAKQFAELWGIGASLRAAIEHAPTRTTGLADRLGAG